MKLEVAGAGMIVVQGLPEFIHDIEGTELFGICTTKRSEEKLKKLSEEHGIAHAHTDYEKMLKLDEIDTVYVAINNHLHYEFGKKAILAGKHVIYERPFTVRVGELKELIALAKQHNVMLLETITSQYYLNYLELEKQLSGVGSIHVIPYNYSQYSSCYDVFKRGEVPPTFNTDMAGGALMDLNVYNMYFSVGLFRISKGVQYFTNTEKRVGTFGILISDYSSFRSVCTAAEDCAGPSQAVIEDENGYLEVEGSASICSTVAYTHRDTKEERRFNPHPDVHHMRSELIKFERTMCERDQKQIEEGQQESLTAMETIIRVREKTGLQLYD